MLLEFLLPRRPISHQSKDAAKRQRWKEYVREEAQKVWLAQAAIAYPCQLTLVYFCGELPADIDNIIKPIQDALVGLVYVDDAYVTDVDSHRRPLNGIFDFTRLPALVLPVLTATRECVYVRVAASQPLEYYL
ncbi:MAG: RusA family crossover junction endodeoxyribonuclease [Hymenobacter sp.]|nr:MAG: RusA family crossover junction endodeoxyribonuclease [Hymenobacter sp.]